jgi:hypothetical protein
MRCSPRCTHDCRTRCHCHSRLTGVYHVVVRESVNNEKHRGLDGRNSRAWKHGRGHHATQQAPPTGTRPDRPRKAAGQTAGGPVGTSWDRQAAGHAHAHKQARPNRPKQIAREELPSRACRGHGRKERHRGQNATWWSHETHGRLEPQTLGASNLDRRVHLSQSRAQPTTTYDIR